MSDKLPVLKSSIDILFIEETKPMSRHSKFDPVLETLKKRKTRGSSKSWKGKMSKRRTTLNIFTDILKTAENEVKKTHIVYKANLNFTIIKKYLKYLKKDGLMTGPTSESRVYKTTDKGVKFLNTYESLQNIFD